MTTHKSFKKLTRTRMEKTGESYTTARRQLLRAGATPEAPVREPAAEPVVEPVVEPPATPASSSSAVKGMRETKGSEESVRKGTGRSFDEWFAVLDAWEATTKDHAAIARWLMSEYELGGWWAQGVTIAYEQERGLRAPGQNSGGFTAGGTKTINVAAADVHAAFADEVTRQRWLPDAPLSVRVARSPKSFRADWVTDRGTETRLIVTIDSLGPAKSRAAILHERLADTDEITELKAFWRARLADLKALLDG